MKLSEVTGNTGKLKLSQVIAPAVADPEKTPTAADEMSTSERLLAGIGQGMTDAGLGAEQLLANYPWLTAALGDTSAAARAAADPEWKNRIAKEAAEKKQIDAPLVDTPAGLAGSLVGNLAVTAPLGAAGSAGKAGSVLGRLGSAALAGAGAGALGGAVQPVADEDYGAEKLSQVGTGAATGALVGGGLNALGQLAELALPKNFAASLLNAANSRAAKTPLAQEGEQLAQQTGVMLTPAQVTGSKAATMAENAARQSVFSRDIAFAGDKARVQQLSDYLDKTLDRVSNSSVSPEVAGSTVQRAAKQILNGLEDWRSKTAAEDYGKIRALTNGAPTIDPINTNVLLRQIFDESSGIGTPTADSIANFAKKQLSNVDPKIASAAKELGGDVGNRVADANAVSAPAQGNLDKLLKLRSHLSKVASGQAKISGEAQDRRIATRLLETIDQDIEDAGDQIGGNIGELLKTANARYREYSQQIASVKASPLGRILGEDISGALQTGQFNSVPPEAVLQRMAALNPSEIGIVRGLLEQDQPRAWNALKRGLLEDAIEKAKAIPPSEGANTAVLRPEVLLKNIGDEKKLKAIFSPDELSQITAGLNVARRLADKTGYNFSGTAGQQEILGTFNKLKEGGLKAAASAGGTVFGTRGLAKLMTSAEGKASLMKLSRLPPSSAKARQLLAELAAIAAAKDDD